MRKKILLISVLVISVCALGYFGFRYYQSASLYNAIADAVKNNDEIDIKKITNFEWDKFYVFKPYTRSEYINETLGFNWNGADPLGLKYDENQLLVFVKDKSVVSSLIFARTDGDFCGNNENEYDADRAVFSKSVGNTLNHKTIYTKTYSSENFSLTYPSIYKTNDSLGIFSLESERGHVEIFKGERPLSGYSSSGLEDFEWQFVPKEKLEKGGYNVWLYYQEGYTLAQEECRSIYNSITF